MTARITISRPEVVGYDELDRRLDAAVDDPGRFEDLAEALLDELDEADRDVEIGDASCWRRGREQGVAGTRSSFVNQFRADVDVIETMSREEEARVARRIEFLRLRLQRWCERAGLDPEQIEIEVGFDPADRTSSASPTDLPRGLERRWVELHALRCEMVERNLYLVLINVERYAHTGASRVDLIQEGSVSLFRAVDGFDWRRGLLFRTYAVHWLNQAFRNYLYNFGSTVRVPVYLQKALKHIQRARTSIGDPDASVEEIARVADLTESVVSTAISASRPSFSIDVGVSEEGEGARLRDLLVLEEDEDPYSTRLEGFTLEQGLEDALAVLSERESLVLRMRFGIGFEHEHTLAEVARHHGVSVERIRQIQMRALSKLDTPKLRRELDPWVN